MWSLTLSRAHRHPPSRHMWTGTARPLGLDEGTQTRSASEGSGRRLWMYSPLFWSHPSLTMVTSLMVPSRRVWCRYTPAPHSQRGRGGEEERRGESEGEERRRWRGGGNGSPSLRVTLPPFLPFPFTLDNSPSLSLARSLYPSDADKRTHAKQAVCRRERARIVLLPVVAYLPLFFVFPSSSTSSSHVPSPDLPSSPVVTQPERKWKEREKKNMI